MEKVRPVEVVVGALTSYVLVTPLITASAARCWWWARRRPPAGPSIRAVEASTPLLRGGDRRRGRAWRSACSC